jgi:SAM-dependent methyltransferase
LSATAAMRKRPWDHKTLEEHLRHSTELITVAPKSILDVGFGPLRRSTLALQSVFPAANIIAVDNDVALMNSLVNTDLHQNVRYLFGDADAWLPHEQFDLIVVCMSAHAFCHPLRAIANLVENNLARDGHLLFVHRTDAVMRATVRLSHGEGSEEAAEIESLWRIIDAPLPWNLRLICEHDLIAYLCRCLDLAAQTTWSSSHKRNNHETYLDIFGTDAIEAQYEAPRTAWSSRGTPAAAVKDLVLLSNIELTSVLYRTNREGVRHKVPLTDTMRAPGFLDLGVEAGVTPTDNAFREAMLHLLRTVLGSSADDIIGCYYVDERQNFNVWGPDAAVHGAAPATTFTRAIAASDLCPGKNGNPPLLVAMFPGIQCDSIFDWRMIHPSRYFTAIGAKGSSAMLIPLLGEAAKLKEGLSQITEPPADYLVARGGWAREHAGVGATLYVLLFQSPILDSTGELEAFTFLSRRWLEPESVRVLVSLGHAVLSHFEERNATVHSERARLAENLRPDLDRILLGRDYIETLRDATTSLVELIDPVYVATDSLSSAAAIAMVRFPVKGNHEVGDHWKEGKGNESVRNMLDELVADLRKSIEVNRRSDDLAQQVVNKVIERLVAHLIDAKVLPALILAKALSHGSVTCEMLGCACAAYVELRPDTDDGADPQRFLREFVTIAVSMQNMVQVSPTIQSSATVCTPAALDQPKNLVSKATEHQLTITDIRDWAKLQPEIRSWWKGARPHGVSRGCTSWKLAVLLRGRRGKVDDDTLGLCAWDTRTSKLSATVSKKTLYAEPGGK